MSEQNVEAARQLYPGPVDLATTLANPDALGVLRAYFEPLVHPDLETIHDPGYQTMLRDPGAEVSPRGIDGLVTAFQDWLSAWESWVVTPIDFIEVDENRVLAVIEVTARSRTHGVETTIHGGNLLTFKDGKLTRVELFLQRADALQAAGLRNYD